MDFSGAVLLPGRKVPLDADTIINQKRKIKKLRVYQTDFGKIRKKVYSEGNRKRYILLNRR